MQYHLRNKYKSAEQLEPEEEMVRRALREYTVDPDLASSFDFVATKALYGVYVTYYNQFEWNVELPELLSITQFGVALRRVFDFVPDQASRRWFRGKLMNGYLGIKGPLSVQAHNDSGNPKLRKA